MTMALKFKFKTKDEIPAEHLPLYAEREGAWILDVDGAVEKTKLDEFRTTNVSLLNPAQMACRSGNRLTAQHCTKGRTLWDSSSAWRAVQLPA